MRITKASVALDIHKHPVLVKDYAKNYGTDGTFRTPESAVRAMNGLFGLSDAAEEYAWLLALDTRLRVLAAFELSHGTAGGTSVGIREVMIRLLLSGASGFILFHNHPSGDVSASREDISVTGQLADASKLMGIRFHDHIIVGKDASGRENFLSLKEAGVLHND